MTRQAEIDTITHAPVDNTLDPVDAKLMRDRDCAALTLFMMNGVAENLKATSTDFQAALKSVSDLHEAGVTIAAEADANIMVGSPNAVFHGESLRQGFELLTDAGCPQSKFFRRRQPWLHKALSLKSVASLKLERSGRFPSGERLGQRHLCPKIYAQGSMSDVRGLLVSKKD